MSLTPYADALKKHVKVRDAAAAMGVPRSTFFDRLNKEKQGRRLNKSLTGIQPQTTKCRGGKDVKRYIFTAAVRGAATHKDFLRNLEAYAKHMKAELVVGTLANKGRHQLNSEFDLDEYQEELQAFITEEPIIIDGKIRFSPELNLTPAMICPLQGLRTYTKQLWSVFPHPKICVETVATHKNHPTKFMFTTGAITHPCYSDTKAGHRAGFDHVYGALVVEVTKKGIWARHVVPTSGVDGKFYDLDKVVVDGTVLRSEGVDVLVYGDIHVEQLDQACAEATWGYGLKDDSRSLTRVLRPQTQVFHDLMDMTAVNYHELKDTFNRFSRWFDGKNDATQDFNDAYKFMEHVAPMAENNVVVDSNHDYFVRKWLLGFDPGKHEDFDNISTFYELKLATINTLRKQEPFSFVELSLATLFKNRPGAAQLLEDFRFLKRDEGYEVANVELSYHGHYGANGSRGSRQQYKFVAEKSIIGHSHSPGVESGCFQVGTSSKLDLGYNNGPSSWAPTHAIIYPHGGRTLITMSDNRFWADQ